MDQFDLRTCRWLGQGGAGNVLVLSLLLSLVLTLTILFVSGRA